MDDSKPVTETEPTHEELDQILFNHDFPTLPNDQPIVSTQPIDPVTEQTQELSEAVTEQTEQKQNGILLNDNFPPLSVRLPFTVPPEPLSPHDRDLKIMELEALHEAGVIDDEEEIQLQELLKEVEAEIALVKDTHGVTPSDDDGKFTAKNERAQSGGETQSEEGAQSEGEGKSEVESEEQAEEQAEEPHVSVCY